MSRKRHIDIAIEMEELARELITEIRQQLSYFKVSVYKTEMIATIEGKITNLRVIADLFANEAIKEPFLDYEAERNTLIDFNTAEECVLTSRVIRLITNFEQQLEKYKASLISSGASQIRNPDGLCKRVRERRREVLSFCRHGSHNWSFFQSI